MTPTTQPEIYWWLQQLESLKSDRQCTSPQFLRPFHFVTLAIALKTQPVGNVRLPDHLMTYAARMRLWEAIGRQPPVSVNEHDASGRFVPIEALRSRDDVHACSARVAAVARNSKLSSNGIESLSTALSELIDNCYAHADLHVDQLQGLACAQYWQRGNLLQVAIADAGKGIKANMLEADTQPIRERASTSNACALATELGVSSKLGSGDHAGYGLALARQLADLNGGTLLVWSGSEWFHSHNGQTTEGDSSISWRGTLVVAEFVTDNQLSAQSVYSTWPAVRGYSDDDFDF